ncbi:MAG: hypothetical protein AAGH15_27195 [Myxococcota bacterium]
MSERMRKMRRVRRQARDQRQRLLAQRAAITGALASLDRLVTRLDAEPGIDEPEGPRRTVSRTP